MEIPLLPPPGGVTPVSCTHLAIPEKFVPIRSMANIPPPPPPPPPCKCHQNNIKPSHVPTQHPRKVWSNLVN